MTDFTWEKPKNEPKLKRTSDNRVKYWISSGLILGAIAVMMLSGTLAGARYFVTVEEVVNNVDYAGQNVRLSGAVIGDTIEYDPSTGELSFTIANIPDGYTDLATALHEAVGDPARTRLRVYMEKQVMSDLLQNEAQAILTGKIGSDGIFYASELNLKCPSRFQENEKPALTTGQS